MIRFPFGERKKADGETVDTAGQLGILHLPKFMATNGKYQVISGPALLKDKSNIVLWNKLHGARIIVRQYRIREIEKEKREYFIESLNHVLPRQFMVKEYLVGFPLYRYLPISTEGGAERESYFRAFQQVAPA